MCSNSQILNAVDTFTDTLHALHIVPLEDEPSLKVKGEAVSIKQELVSIEPKPKIEEKNSSNIKIKTEPDIQSETSRTTKRKRSLNINDDGIEIVEVREVCKRMKRVRINAEKVIELE
jgi:hypothetical protein